MNVMTRRAKISQFSSMVSLCSATTTTATATKKNRRIRRNAKAFARWSDANDVACNKLRVRDFSYTFVLSFSVYLSLLRNELLFLSLFWWEFLSHVFPALYLSLSLACYCWSFVSTRKKLHTKRELKNNMTHSLYLYRPLHYVKILRNFLHQF